MILKPFAAKNGLSFSPVYCTFPVDYIIPAYMMTTLHSCTVRDIYIAALPFLIN